MVYVSVSETYDLSTVPNKMTLIGVHTPDTGLITKMYPGLCMNAKFCRIVSQDVTIACASMEAADPLQVGTDPGAIAPEDLFNPILYKAVSNASMSNIEARIHGLGSQASADVSISGHQAVVDNDEVTGMDDEFPVYYGLLSNRDGFKAANPQQGLTMTNLRPLVFERLYNVGTWKDDAMPSTFPVIEKGALTGDYPGVMYANYQAMQGDARPMPRFPTTYLTGTYPKTGDNTRGTHYQYNGMEDGQPANYQIKMPHLMPVFTAAIIVPPSKLHKLFYRMVIRTHLEFTEVRPITEVTSFGNLGLLASDVYYSDYEDVSKRFASTRLDQVDISSGNIEKVMEGS